MESHNNILPEEIDCPICGISLELEYEERIEKKFTCPSCKAFIDFTIDNEKYFQSKVDNTSKYEILGTEQISSTLKTKDKSIEVEISQGGVYYDRDDYADIFKRFVIDVIDFVFLFFVFIILLTLTDIYFPEDSILFILSFQAWLVFSYIYLALLKLSSFGTIGYMLLGVKLVNLRGTRPTIWETTVRFSFIVVGPLNLIIDLLWLTDDEDKQCFRDKFAGTYVVMKKATPIGIGKILNKIYNLFGMTFFVEEVQRSI